MPNGDRQQHTGNDDLIAEALPLEVQAKIAKDRRLETARQRLARIDVRSDGSTQGDKVFHDDTLAFLEKECLHLPDDKFLALLSQIESILLQRNAEKERVKEQTRTALEAMMASVKQPWKKTEIWNKVYELSPISQQILRVNFHPALSDKKNTQDAAKHLHNFMSTPDLQKKFRNEVESSPDRITGFILHWTPNHPVYQELLRTGKKDVTKVLNEIRTELALAYGISTDACETPTVSQKKIIARHEQIAQGKNYGPEIFAKGFSPSFDAKKTADYAEYLVSPKGEKDLEKFYVQLRKDRNAVLGFIENMNHSHPAMLELKKRGSSVAVTMLMGFRSSILNDYGIPDPLPKNFKEKKHEYFDNFEKREKNAKELKGFNKLAKGRLELLWKQLNEAYREQDTIKIKIIGQDVEAYFNGTFLPRLALARKDFSTLPENVIPPEFKDIERMASVRILFRDLYASDKQKHAGQNGEMFDSVKASFSSTAKSLANATGLIDFTAAGERQKAYHKAFRSAMGGESVNLVFSSDGKVKSQSLEDFWINLQSMNQGRGEVSSDGFARYIGLLHDTLWPEKMRTELRAKWNGNYDSLVLKFGSLWGLFEEKSQNKTTPAQEILRRIAPEALEVFKWIVKNDGTNIIRQRSAGSSLKDVEVNLRANAKLDAAKISAIMKKLHNHEGNVMMQFEILCAEVEHLPYATVLKFFEKTAATNADKAELYREKGNTIIAFDAKMSTAPGFEELLAHVRSRAQNGDEDTSTQKRYKELSVELSNSMELTSAGFLQKTSPETLAEILRVAKSIHSDKAYGRSEKLGIFATWLEAKIQSRKHERTALEASEGVKSARGQMIARRQTPSSNLTTEERKGISEGIKKAQPKIDRAIEARLIVDTVRSEGNEALAKAVTKQLTGSDSWDARNVVSNYETFSNGIENLEKIGFFKASETDGKPDAQNAKSALMRAFPNLRESASKQEGTMGEFPASEYSNQATRFLHESLPGTRTTVGGYVASKTPGGGFEISTADGKLRFDHKEAVWAAQQMDIMLSAGAEFLIPAMKEISSACEVDFKHGISRNETRKLLSHVAEIFGIEGISNEPDAKTMLDKFQRAANGTGDGETLLTKARKLGLVDDAGKLRREAFSRETFSRETFVKSAA